MKLVKLLKLVLMELNLVFQMNEAQKYFDSAAEIIAYGNFTIVE